MCHVRFPAINAEDGFGASLLVHLFPGLPASVSDSVEMYFTVNLDIHALQAIYRVIFL